MDVTTTTRTLGNPGEFVGAIVVTITLIFLATELRHSTRALEPNRRIVLAQNAQERSYRCCSRMQLHVDSTSIASVMANAESAEFPHNEACPDVLDDVELRRLWVGKTAQRERMENVAFQERAGFHRFEHAES